MLVLSSGLFSVTTMAFLMLCMCVIQKFALPFVTKNVLVVKYNTADKSSLVLTNKLNLNDTPIYQSHVGDTGPSYIVQCEKPRVCRRLFTE